MTGVEITRRGANMNELLDLALRAHVGLDRWGHNNFQVGGEQTNYFNEHGLSQQFDYLAVGPAAHYCFDHANYNGVVFPTVRRVVRRPPSGPLVYGPKAVLIQITDVVIGEGERG